MRKIETIWHHLLYCALEEKRYKWTQQELANEFKFSLSTVNHALAVPSQMGAVRKTSKFFVLQDFDKLLYYWASLRKLEADVIYQTYWESGVAEIEGLIPPNSIYAAYSAARKLLGEPPADYSQVYFYYPPENIAEVQTRFPPNKRAAPNIVVLRLPSSLSRYGPITTLPQTFVDIWNLPDWYSRDFTNELSDKMHELLS